MCVSRTNEEVDLLPQKWLRMRREASPGQNSEEHQHLRKHKFNRKVCKETEAWSEIREKSD